MTAVLLQVRVLMFICWPIAWPISKFLDWMLGSEHSALFRRAELKVMTSQRLWEWGAEACLGGTMFQSCVASASRLGTELTHILRPAGMMEPADLRPCVPPQRSLFTLRRRS